MTEPQTWHTDRIVLRFAALLSDDDRNGLCAGLGHDTAFMTEFGPYECDDPTVASIAFHAWAARRFICDVRFASGARYADRQISIGADLPETVRMGIVGIDAMRCIPHRAFEGTTVAPVTNKASALEIRIDLDVDLGWSPGPELGRRIRLHNPGG